MRRLSFLAAFVGLGLAAGRLDAEPVPHLDLVRGLRQQGMPDFALEYLDRLKGMKLPEIEPLLPLEYARTRLDLAAEEPDERKRGALLTQAREEFDQFLKSHPNHPQAAAANLDLARLVSLQAKGMLMKARRAENKDQENKEKAIARSFFQQAAQRFEQAAKQSDAKLKTLDDNKDKALKADLQQARLRALLDQGVNLYDMAQTYNQEGAELVARGDVIRKAIKVFEQLLNETEKTAPVWVAHAWIGQCYYENDDRPKAEAEFQNVLKERTPAALPAGRLVRAFKVRHAFEGEDTSKNVNRYTVARNLADAWLRDFPAARNSPEGLGVRFVMARSLQREAESGVKRDKASGKAVGISGTAEQQLKTAERIYRDLADTDNEYTDRATRSRMQSILTRSDGANKGETKPDQVRKFEEGYLQALVQQARLTEYTTQLAQGKVNASDPAKAIKDEEQKRSKATVEFLTRALELAAAEKPAPPAREVHEAKVLLAYCYPLVGEPRKAAELAETLAREGPKARSAPQMAALAVNEYVVLLNRLRQSEDGGDDREKQAGELAGKVKDLTVYMEKTWPDEAATDGARHTLGYLLRYEKKFDEALKVYGRIRPTYPALAAARLEQGGALFALVRNTDETNPQKLSEYVADNIAKHQREWKQTVADMEAVPPPVAAAAAADAQTYCQMRMQLGQLYLLEGKQYDRAEATARALTELIPKLTGLKDREGLRDDLLYGARALEVAAIQGRGFLLLKERKYAEVAKLLDPLVEKIKAEVDKGPPANTPPNFERLRRAQRDVLSLSLRASVQDNKIDRARDLLDLLQKVGGTAEGSAAVFRQLASTIRAQIETLRKENKPDEEKKLVDGFTQFLDSIAKQEKIPDSMLLFLSQGYAGVDQHGKAAELLERILKNPAAKPKDGDDPKAAERFRQQVQYLLAREYRLGKDFNKAKKLVAEMLGTPQKRGWGFSSVEVRKESFFLLEDQKKYAEAVKAWVAYASNFAQKLPPYPAKDNKEASHRRLYFELFFESQRCSARAYFEFDPSKAADPAKAAQARDDGFGRVAQRLVDLEAKNPDLTPELKERIRDLLDQYPPLKEKYKAARAKATGPSVSSAQ